MKTEQHWRRDAVPGLRITGRAMPAPGNILISASGSEDSWGWTWLAWVTSSSVSQLLASPLGSRNVYEALQVSLRSSCFLNLLCACFPEGIRIWHPAYCLSIALFNTSGPSSAGQNSPPEHEIRAKREKQRQSQETGEHLPEWRKYLHGRLTTVTGQECSIESTHFPEKNTQ